jgi:Fe2+ or Zn2+ uptake regulation protein
MGKKTNAAVGGQKGRFGAELKARGQRVTEVRLNVLAILANAEVPLGIRVIHRGLSRHHDLVTMYRCLERLEQIGLVRRVFDYDGTSLHFLATRGDQYFVRSKNGGSAAMIEASEAKRLHQSVQRTVEHLKTRGYRDVTPCVVFYGSPPPKRPN